MRNLFVGGSSEIAVNIAKVIKNTDNLSRKKNKVYKFNYKVKNYEEKNLKIVFKRIKIKYDNIIIFNGEYGYSFLSNFNEKLFIKSLNINLLTPLKIAKLVIENKLLKKDGSLFFVSSIATKVKQKGNSYYSISKNALELSAKILGEEQKYRNVRVNIINFGLVKNKMGLSTLKYLSENKIKKAKFISMKKIIILFNNILKNKKNNLKKINLT